MARDDVTPVRHTSGSEFGAKTAGTVGGALKGGIGTALLWVVGVTAAFACLGVAIGLGLPLFGAAELGQAGSAFAQFIFSAPVLWGVGLGAVGAAIGLGTAWLPGGVGAIAGGLGGNAKASERVARERAAAMEMDYQLAAMQAQAPAQPAPSQPVTVNQNVGLPPQGSRFNQAASSIQAVSAANDGTLAQLQLQRQ